MKQKVSFASEKQSAPRKMFDLEAMSCERDKMT